MVQYIPCAVEFRQGVDTHPQHPQYERQNGLCLVRFPRVAPYEIRGEGRGVRDAQEKDDGLEHRIGHLRPRRMTICVLAPLVSAVLRDVGLVQWKVNIATKLGEEPLELSLVSHQSPVATGRLAAARNRRTRARAVRRT